VPDHLNSGYINMIALGLDEDVYGANGNLDEIQILERLIRNVHNHTGHQYAQTGMIPVGAVAALVRSVWEYKVREVMEQMGRVWEHPLPDTIEEAVGGRHGCTQSF
jgi:hypothetical protein